MKRVIGALFGLVALAFYAAGASELAVSFLTEDPRTQYVPAEVLAHLAQAPILWGEAPEAWRLPLMGAALGAGVVGGFFLVFGARIAAVFLWLAFLLLGGVLIGHDAVMARAYESGETMTLVFGAGLLLASFLLALVGQATTGRDDDVELTGAAAPAMASAYDSPARAREREPEPPRRREPEPEPVAAAPAPEPEPVAEHAGSDAPLEELEVAEAEVVEDVDDYEDAEDEDEGYEDSDEQESDDDDYEEDDGDEDADDEEDEDEGDDGDEDDEAAWETDGEEGEYDDEDEDDGRNA